MVISCTVFLKKLNNEKVKIEESSDNEASLYIAVTNKILIANISNTYKTNFTKIFWLRSFLESIKTGISYFLLRRRQAYDHRSTQQYIHTYLESSC